MYCIQYCIIYEEDLTLYYYKNICYNEACFTCFVISYISQCHVVDKDVRISTDKSFYLLYFYFIENFTSCNVLEVCIDPSLSGLRISVQLLVWPETALMQIIWT
uniref:Uncharacterized protein n=1 Tax=Pyxicephalus adspersus TaxID=30357 RepID=A0AAV2ZVL1_PYXAD|nr:TPA: hypothetical protein GDO54_003512 [Pyxicephalus adspersus]